MIMQLLNSNICWAILLLALLCYQQLWSEYLIAASRKKNDEHVENDYRQHEFTSILIGALPLLGLLGTIAGLLDCFSGIASDGASSEVMSSGIASALLTTQLGLVCAIPGWLLQAWIRSSIQNNLTVEPSEPQVIS